MVSSRETPTPARRWVKSESTSAPDKDMNREAVETLSAFSRPVLKKRKKVPEEAGQQRKRAPVARRALCVPFFFTVGLFQGEAKVWILYESSEEKREEQATLHRSKRDKGSVISPPRENSKGASEGEGKVVITGKADSTDSYDELPAAYEALACTPLHLNAPG